MNEDPSEQSALFHLMMAIRKDLLDPGPLFERPAPTEICRRRKRVKREWEEEYLTNYMFASARPSRSEIGVRGELLIKDFATEGACRANCTFASSTQWASNPIKVFCTEPWIKKEVNWHLVPEILERPAKDDAAWRLCYELEQRWCDCIEFVRRSNKDPLKTITFAAAFCLQASRWLIEKHLFAYRQNITKWPPEWLAWPHNREAAERLYRQETLKAG